MEYMMVIGYGQDRLNWLISALEEAGVPFVAQDLGDGCYIIWAGDDLLEVHNGQPTTV